MTDVEGGAGKPLLLKIPEAAKELRIGLTKLYELMRDDEIVGIRIGPNATRIPYSEIEAYVARKLAAELAERGLQRGAA